MSTSTVGTVTSTGYLYDKAGMRLTQGYGGIGTDSTKQKQEILQINIEKNQGQPRCANCSRPVTPGQKNLPGVAIPKDRIEYDHIKPYTKGGPTVVENGQVLCRACNLTKGSSDLMNKEKP